jgi:hypothetical protein
VLAPGVEEMAPESEEDEPSLDAPGSSFDPPEDASSLDDESYGSVDVLVLDDGVDVDVAFFATLASAGSSPS